MNSLILASGSKRRRQLLRKAGFSFKVIPSGIAENTIPKESPARLAKRLARAKASAVARRFPRAIVLAADTIVVLGKRVLGKPAGRQEARSMLKFLRGREHQVITALALAAPGRNLRSVTAVTTVQMRRYSDQEINRYVASGDPMDKAGAYTIQNKKFSPVARYEGCYCNVMGLPLWTAVKLIGADSGSRLPRRCASCPLRTCYSSAELRVRWPA